MHRCCREHEQAFRSVSRCANGDGVEQDYLAVLNRKAGSAQPVGCLESEAREHGLLIARNLHDQAGPDARRRGARPTNRQCLVEGCEVGVGARAHDDRVATLGRGDGLREIRELRTSRP